MKTLLHCFMGAAAACLTLALPNLGMAEDPAPSMTTGGDTAPATEPAPSVTTPEAAPAPQVKPPKEVSAFLDRVFKNLPAANTSFAFKSWPQAGKPTEEGVGMMPLSGVSPEAIVKRVMDVDHYKGNIDHVIENRSIKDARFTPPQAVRFYQHLDLSLLGDIHHELVLVDGGMRDGYRVLYWYLLEKESSALKRDVGMRSAYNVGAWIISKDKIGYALSSAPKKDDTNYLQWKSLTSGADLAAKSVVEDNIKGMVAWAKR